MRHVESPKGGIYYLNNIYAKIDGKNGENGSYIMLASHYDSSPKKEQEKMGSQKVLQMLDMEYLLS